MKKTSIMRKITLRIMLIGLATFVLSLLLSYVLIVPGLRKNAIQTAEKANAEIIQQLDNLYAYVEDYTENLSLSVAQNAKIQEYFALPGTQRQYRAALNLNNLVSHEGVVRCVMIENEDGVRLDSINSITDQDYALLDTDWYRTLHAADYGRSVSCVYPIRWNNRDFLTTAYSKNFYSANRRYTFTVFFNLDDLLYDSGVVAGNTLDDYLMLDSTWAVFYSSGDADWQAAMAPAIVEDWPISQRNRPAQGGICFRQSSIHTKWAILSFVSEGTIFRSFQGNVVSIVIIMLVFLLVTLSFLPGSLSKIVQPISRLSAAMSTAAQNDWNSQVDITSNDEIGELSQSFNKMLKDLKNSIEIIAQKEKLEQKIKFSLLVSQINPHFIYNTLNSINYLARRGACEDIIVVNSALIYILQDRLRVSDIEIMDTIEKERKVVDQYISIQRYVYKGDLTLAWEVEEGLPERQIPKNIIQPLVENAIFHGLIREETGEMQGHISIAIRRVGEEIEIIVQDDGCGMEDEMLQALRAPILSFQPYERGKNIGIPNIRGRLYYLYGNADCMTIESAPGKGTRITLRFAVNAEAAPIEESGRFLN